MPDTLPDKLEKALDQLFAAGPKADTVQATGLRLKNALRETGMMTITYGVVPETPIGTVFVAQNEHGVIDIDFGVTKVDFLARLQKRHGASPRPAAEEMTPILNAIADYLHDRTDTLDIPFDIGWLTSFQQQVLLAALQIPRGKFATYTQVAERIGNPKAVRAVGQALGRNPIPLLIPCHRVIAASGNLGGYSGGGGVETKRRLLVMEGALIG